MDTPIRRQPVCIDCGRNPGTKIGQNGYSYCGQCWKAQPSKSCSNGACPACCGCGDCVTWLAGEPSETRWNCVCGSTPDNDGSAGDPEFEKDTTSDPTTAMAPEAMMQGNPSFDKHRVAGAPDPFIGGSQMCDKCGGCKCGGSRHRNCGRCSCGTSESIIDLLADTLAEGVVSESKLSKIYECFDFDVKEKKSAKGAHGGGNEYKQIELDHEFEDLADRAPQSKPKPKKPDEPESDPGEGETGEKPNSQKTPKGFKKTETGLPKEKDKPGKMTKSPHEAFDRSLDAILEMEDRPWPDHGERLTPGPYAAPQSSSGACSACGKPAKWYQAARFMGNKPIPMYCTECTLKLNLSDVVRPVTEDEMGDRPYIMPHERGRNKGHAPLCGSNALEACDCGADRRGAAPCGACKEDGHFEEWSVVSHTSSTNAIRDTRKVCTRCKEWGEENGWVIYARRILESVGNQMSPQHQYDDPCGACGAPMGAHSGDILERCNSLSGCPKCKCPVSSHKYDDFEEYGCQEVIDVDQEVGKTPIMYRCRCQERFGDEEVVKENADLPGHGPKKDPSSLEERTCVSCHLPFMVDLSGPRSNRTMCDECRESIQNDIMMARHKERRP